MVQSSSQTGDSRKCLRRIDRQHWVSVFQAFLVTILWSSSWVIIKFGLQEITPLIFAGLRYSVASIILLGATMISPSRRASLKGLSRAWWGKLAVYGLLYYTVTQGVQFLGLALLPAITVSFLLNFTTILVVIFSIFLLGETPNKKQVLLVGVALLGAYLYFYPIDLPAAAMTGVLIVIVGVVANALSSILGRAINRTRELPPLLVTVVSMTIGSAILAVSGLVVDGLPALSALGILYILWLGVVNTAFAFTLWNRAMQRLRAVETTIINSTMMGQIALLALIFLGEMPTLAEWMGIILVMVSALLIQLFRVQTGGNNSSQGDAAPASNSRK